jgi:hypothetical protein
MKRSNAEHRLENLIAGLWLFALFLTSCGGAPDPADRAQNQAARSAPVSATADPPSASVTVEGKAAAKASREQLTPEYLAGTWCYSPLDGDGERGIFVFDRDGSYQVGIGGTESDHYLEEGGDLERFWQYNDGPVEVEPDRFVVLMSHSKEVEFRRAPCSHP